MFEPFIEKILTHKKVGVFSHVSPDGDCLGSQIALCLWLQKNGAEAVAFNEDSIPPNLTWLTSYFSITHPKKADLNTFDAFVVVDGNALHRFGKAAEKLPHYEKPIYMIDHHPEPDDIFTEPISETGCSSTCELIYELYATHNPDQIDAAAAKAMYTGIVTDTGSFQFDSVTPRTMQAAADLLQRGDFKPNLIAERIYAARPLRQLKLLSMALETITLHADGRLASICITKEMMRETGSSKEDTEGFVQYPLSVTGVMACVLFREDEDRIKLSLRSQSDVDVNKWARELNGGGHKKAAGASHPGPLEKAIEEVIAIGEKQLV